MRRCPSERMSAQSGEAGGLPPAGGWRIWRMLVRGGLAGVLLVWAAGPLSWSRLRPYLAAMDWTLLAVAGGCGILLVALRALRFRLLLRAGQVEVTLVEAVRATLGALGVRLAVPGRLGELLRPRWLGREADPASYVVGGLDLALEAAVVLLLAVPAVVAWMGPAVGALHVLAAVALIAGVRQPAPALRALARLPLLAGLARAAQILERGGFPLRVARLAQAAGLAAGAVALRAGIVYVALLALGQAVSQVVLLVVPLVLLVEGLPITVGGLGVREGVGLALLVPLGVAPEPAFAALLVLFLVGTLLPGAGGIWILLAARSHR